MNYTDTPATPRWAASSRARVIAASRVIGTCFATIITLAMLGLFVVAPLLHIGFSPVLTGSMRPAYAPGDLLITVQADVSSLNPGQIAVFTPPGETVPYAHRITAISGSPAQPVLTTKGDANPAPDRWRATLTQPQVPVVIAIVPSAGNALLWIQNPIPRALLTALFGLILTGGAVRWILKAAPHQISPTTPEPAV